ncbi:MAG: hypothetical protein F4074_05570 [Synechococcus sp. SB0672_bin_10]|nr:hypothetical protein [Synechococcus sp. SB0672_bin_10]
MMPSAHPGAVQRCRWSGASALATALSGVLALTACGGGVRYRQAHRQVSSRRCIGRHREHRIRPLRYRRRALRRNAD